MEARTAYTTLNEALYLNGRVSPLHLSLLSVHTLQLAKNTDEQDYWRLPSSATLLDVVRAVRADEATHRFVNHSLADLDQKHDFNPFALGEASAEIRGTTAGFTREQSAQFAKESQRRLAEKTEMERHRVAAPQ